MLDSYIRRQRWLARLHGVQTINAYAEAMNGSKRGGRAQKVDGQTMWQMLTGKK